MPWNQGGGGPWGGGGGGGGQNPWGQRGGGQQPNIEELIRKGQERVKRIMPGGFGPNLVIIGIVVAALGLWIISGFFIVRPGEVGLVLRFGQLVRIAEPDWHIHWPTPIESVMIVDVNRPNFIEVPARTAADVRGARVPQQGSSVPVLTGDENIIDVQYTVQWRVADAALFRFNVDNQEALIRGTADSALRQVVSQTTAQRALTEGRAEIAEAIQRLTQQLLDGYQAGVQIMDVQIRSIEPPQQVIDAFRDVQRAKADRERLRNEAEAYRNDIVPRARGEAQRLVFEAEGYRQRVVAESQGEASRFEAVIGAYRAAPEVTTQRLYLETMEQVLRGSNRVIMDGAGAAGGVVPYLALPELRRPGATAPPTGAAPGAAPNVGSTGGRQ